MMENSKIRCVRCKGRKKLYKINNCYSYTNTGGVEIQCPLCLGTGYTKSLEDAIKEVKQSNIKSKQDKNGKDCKDAEKAKEDTGQT